MNEMLSTVGSAVWPIISHHPVTGRPYVNVSESNTRWIIGIGAAESARILTMLFDIINRPDHQVRLRWQPGTVAIWDNRATQHYAVSDYPDDRRVMHRVAVAATPESERRATPSGHPACAGAPGQGEVAAAKGRPATTVPHTSMSLIDIGSTSSGSSASTVKSAALPHSIEPNSSSRWS